MAGKLNCLGHAAGCLNQAERYATEDVAAFPNAGATAASTAEHAATKEVTKCLENIGNVIELMLPTTTTTL
jgi:hypothetical protein